MQDTAVLEPVHALRIVLNETLFQEIIKEAAICQITPSRFAVETLESYLAGRRLDEVTAQLSEDDLLARDRQVKPEGYRKRSEASA